MRRSRGFTVLEVVVGLSLTAISVATGIVQLAALLQMARIGGTARTIAAVLRLTRGRALAVGASAEVRFDRALGTWQADTGGMTTVYRLPTGVVFAALPAQPRIRFGALGTAENGTITLAAGPRLRRVVVNQRGRVRVQ